MANHRLKDAEFALFILKEKASKLPLDFFSGFDNVIQNFLDLLQSRHHTKKIQN